MKKKNVLPWLWDFGIIWICETANLTVSSSRYAGGRTPIEIITGETPDISEYVDFGFYDWVVYRSNDENEYIDGTTEVISANVIAENILAQVDEEGHRQLMIDEIIDHCTNSDAMPRERGHYMTQDYTMRWKMTTKGWELCVIWKDGSTNWIELKDLKSAYPVQLAEYAINDKIEDQPVFAWWVPYVIKKRTRIVSKLKSKYWQRTPKYGICKPKNIDEAEAIGKMEIRIGWMPYH